MATRLVRFIAAWLLMSPLVSIAQQPNSFERDRLVAWCIVPFDDRERTPDERGEMLNRLGLKRYAYDYRANHIPTFDAEMEAMKRHGIELTAWWFPTVMNDEGRLILDVLRRHQIQAQLWVTGGGEPTNSPDEQAARVAAEADRIRPIADAAAEIGCRVSLYNHGGWFGEPENQIAIIQAVDRPNVGIVYNLHHGHQHLDRFAQLLDQMIPYLDCLNLNGMVRDGEQTGRKILPIGDGDLETGLIRTIRRSGYQGPIGILNHTQENAETRLQQNIQGLETILQQLDDEPAAASETDLDLSQYSPAAIEAILAAATTHGVRDAGTMVYASAKYACINCHQVGRHGGQLGPDLTSISQKKTPHQIVEGLYWPQHSIAAEYQAIAIVDVDGQVFRGYEQSRDDQTVVIRDPASGKTHPIAIDDIEAEQTLGSLMPEGLMAAMEPQQRHDLLLWLLSLGNETLLPEAPLDSALVLARAHLGGPATFPLDREPLHPAWWPTWQSHVNRDRVYDFYAKQANFFRGRDVMPPLLAAAPAMDGGQQGHWGNQDDTTWSDARRNDSDLGSLQSGVVRVGDRTIARGLCVHLGGPQQMSVCFNPETLQYEAVWTGGFVRYSDFRSGLLHGALIDGQLIDGLQQPLIDAVRQPWQSPAVSKKYLGLYRQGDEIGFLYSVDGVTYLDVPQCRDGQFVSLVHPLQQHALAAITKPAALPVDAIDRQPIVMPIEIANSDAAYELDNLVLPTDNPWNSVLYLGGVAFDAGGAVYVCTYQGEVWKGDRFDYPSTQIHWIRFASGLFEPLGIVIDSDGIFVQGRDQLTRLHDRNQDGVADFYERFSGVMETSPGGHDYICGLQRDPQGRFYTVSGNQGLLRIAADGSSLEVLATGFRNADGLGLDADGRVTVPQSEGEWVPASAICLVDPQATTPQHFGYGGPKNGEVPSLPMVYLPRLMDNSSGGQTLIHSDRMGPLGGHLVHFSFGAASQFLVLRDSVAAAAGIDQAAVVPLRGEFLSGAHRGSIRLQDGQLYVAGGAGWGCYGTLDGSLQRVRYTGARLQLPVDYQVYQNGIRLRFDQPLDAAIAGDPAQHFAQAWNYRYGPGYGSPEFSPSHPLTPGHDTLAIAAAHVAADGHHLFLELPGLQSVNQLHLSIRTSASETSELFATVHQLGEPYRDYPGYVASEKTVNPHPIHHDLVLATRMVPNPWRHVNPAARIITIDCNSDLTFATPQFTVKPGELITVSLVNPDAVPHNWALLRPGSLERVGELTNRFISDPEAPLRHYVPDSEDVIVYTDIVSPHAEFSICFHAPSEPGRYPYLCTFPGHWKIMNGVMVVQP